MQNLGNVYICRSPFVMSRTDAQNGLYSIFKGYRLTERRDDNNYLTNRLTDDFTCQVESATTQWVNKI
jgi:hypothetical protein